MEVALNGMEARLQTVESTCTALSRENESLKFKVDDLENRSRRNNIRITGVPEKVEGPQPTAFMELFLAETFGAKAFPSPPAVDRAHRVATARKTQSDTPRPFIARIHNFQTKERILKLAREAGPLSFRGCNIHIFPDYSVERPFRSLWVLEIPKLVKKTPSYSQGLIYPHLTGMESRLQELKAVDLQGEGDPCWQDDDQAAAGLKDQYQDQAAAELQVEDRDHAAAGLQDEDQAAAGLKDEDQTAAGLRDEDQAAAGLKDEDQAAAGLRDEDQAPAGLKDEDQAAAGLKDEDQAAAGLKDEDQAAAGLKDEDQAPAGLKVEDQAAAGLKDEDQAPAGLKDEDQVAAGQQNEAAAGLKDEDQAAAGLKDQGQAAAGLKEEGQAAAGLKEEAAAGWLEGVQGQ
ncbi:Antho-RFamide neuropeptides-like, partial [Dissostichus eleginoides]